MQRHATRSIRIENNDWPRLSPVLHLETSRSRSNSWTTVLQLEATLHQGAVCLPFAGRQNFPTRLSYLNQLLFTIFNYANKLLEYTVELCLYNSSHFTEFERISLSNPFRNDQRIFHLIPVSKLLQYICYFKSKSTVGVISSDRDCYRYSKKTYKSLLLLLLILLFNSTI